MVIWDVTQDINSVGQEEDVLNEHIDVTTDVSCATNDTPTPTYCSIGTQKAFQFYTLETFRNDKAIHFYTGLETFEKFMFVFHTLCPEAYSLRYRRSQVLNISAVDQFLMTLMKLRRNKHDYELSFFFNIHQSSVSNIVGHLDKFHAPDVKNVRYVAK